MIDAPLPGDVRPETRTEYREREALTKGLISAGKSNRGGRATRSVNQDAFFSGSQGFHLGEVGGSIDRPSTPEQNVAGMISALNGLDVYTIRGENKETIALAPQDIIQTGQDVATLVKSGKMRGIDVVADGVGGGAHGELASSIVTYIFVREITSAVKEDAPVTDDLLREAVVSANDVLRSYNLRHRTASQTSLLAQVTDKEGQTRIASVLDSRAYKETADGQVTRLTVDQNQREEAIAAGSHDLLNADTVRNKPTRVLGFTDDTPENPFVSRETVQINRTQLAPGDYLYLVSDGVSEGYDPQDPTTARILQRVNQTYLHDLAYGMSQIEARHKAEGTIFKEIHLQHAPDNIQDLARYLTRNEVGHHSKDNVTAVVIEQAGARGKKIEKQVRELGAMGDQLLADGNAREALAIFEQAVALGGTETPWNVYYNRGRAYAATERYGDAIRDFKIAAQSEPDSVKPFWRLGEAYLATDLLGAAETAFHHAATMPVREGDEKAQEKAKAGLVKVTKVSQQRMVDERKELEKTQKEIRADIRKLGGSGNQLLTEGRTQEALATYTQAIARGGGLTPWNIYYNRGRANIAAENPGAAMNDFLQAAQLEPLSVKPVWKIGETYLALGNLDEAERAFHHAASMPVREGDENAQRKAREGLTRIAEQRNVAVPEPSIDPDPVSRAVSWAKRRWEDRRRGR